MSEERPHGAYSKTPPLPRAEAERVLAAGDPDAVCDALVRLAFHEPDWRWVQDLCLARLDGASVWVRRAAAICLGHLARIHGILDRAKVEAALRDAAKRHEDTRGAVDDALGDIRHFLGKNA
jgi:hypothetical protein